MGAVGWSNGRSYRLSGDSYCFIATQSRKIKSKLCSTEPMIRSVVTVAVGRSPHECFEQL